PTEDDALPSSLIEAMACQLPVVTTPVGAIQSIIINGRNGISVSPKNFQQLYDALVLVMNSKELAHELGRAGWHTVQENYSAKIVTQKYTDLFKMLIQQNQYVNNRGMVRPSDNKTSITVESQE
ncbi:MAG: glycosyltransferase family 4 protein, partial [candidate division Zixibacteria bacterium]|nr:glycosyltransferase family 4 protein [Phycisphaerae bacterium]NIR67373.1 glycosyltransferase family 4 protein [candidate division Zixibacteria bacterium]NIU16295.1 glycosyltransferase family 4 protein [candidate division Zixibacteria bacterium]NIW48147.1 glycosyltransferase [Gammaproteobacteria bacterium]